MNTTQLIDILNELLQGERAGARVTTSFAQEASDAELRNLMVSIAADERTYAKKLHEHIERLGGVPSEKIGDFYDKAMHYGANERGVKFLNRGQQWVVNILKEVTANLADQELLDDLTEMLKAHESNIWMCERYLYLNQSATQAVGA